MSHFLPAPSGYRQLQHDTSSGQALLTRIPPAEPTISVPYEDEQRIADEFSRLGLTQPTLRASGGDVRVSYEVPPNRSATAALYSTAADSTGSGVGPSAPTSVGNVMSGSRGTRISTASGIRVRSSASRRNTNTGGNCYPLNIIKKLRFATEIN